MLIRALILHGKDSLSAENGPGSHGKDTPSNCILLPRYQRELTDKVNWMDFFEVGWKEGKR